MIARRSYLSIILAFFLFLFGPVMPVQAKPSTPTITIGMVTFPGYAPLYVAKALKLFHGVHVKLIRIESIGDLRSALLAGRIDMYLATYDIFESIEMRPPVGKMIYAIDTSVGADGVAVSKSIKTISDIIGRNVGAEAGFPPYFVLTYMLYKAGHKLSETNILDMPSGDIPSAFASGQIDVAATYEPYLSKCLTVRKGAHILISSANVPGLISDFMVASSDFIAKNPKAIKSVIAGWNLALRVIAKKPKVTYPIMAKAFGVSVADMHDFSKVVKWLGTADNRTLFTSKGDNNVYRRYDEVNKALRLNNSAITKSSAHNFVDSTFVGLE